MRDTNAPIATIKNLVDPASFACLEFLKTHKTESTREFNTVNLRDLLADSNQYPVLENHEEKMTKWFSTFVDQSNKPVYLVPMHTFSVGFDDRSYLGRLARASKSSKVEVICKPIPVWKTMELFYNAFSCVGMRYHAVLFQTLLNGNNCIIDYTHPKSGKIISLMRQLDMLEPYHDRYVSIAQSENGISFSDYEDRVFHFGHELVLRHFSTYIDLLNKAFVR